MLKVEGSGSPVSTVQINPSAAAVCFGFFLDKGPPVMWVAFSGN